MMIYDYVMYAVQLLRTLDSGKGVDLAGLPDPTLRGLLSELLSNLGLHKSSKVCIQDRGICSACVRRHAGDRNCFNTHVQYKTGLCAAVRVKDTDHHWIFWAGTAVASLKGLRECKGT
jgi:hypothetical protein